jgi:hypothetical protein
LHTKYIFYKIYKKVLLHIKFMMHSSQDLTERPYKTLLPSPLHSTTLTSSPPLIFPLLPLHVRRTQAKEKRRDFYISD